MSQVIRKAYLDRADKEMTFATFQDVEPILEQNKMFRSMEQTNRELKHVASVPINIINQWLTEEAKRGNLMSWGSPEFEAMLNRKLSDPEWSYLRTDGPRHSIGYGDS